MPNSGTIPLGGRVHPKWNLGDLPDMLNTYKATPIQNQDDLAAFVEMAHSDLEYGSKLLLSIDRLRASVSTNGINKDMLEDLEFQTGRLMPVGESVRRCMTSNFGRTGQKEVLVALESSGKYGKAALLLLIIAALMKLIGWLTSNASSFGGGAGTGSGEGYAEKVNAKDTSALDDANVADKIRTALVKDLYIDAYKDLDKNIRSKFNSSILILDGVIQAVKADGYFTKLATLQNKFKPLKSVVEACAKGEYSSEADILTATVRHLLEHNLTAGIYQVSKANHAWEQLPRRYKSAGVKILTDMAVKNMENALSSIVSAMSQISTSMSIVMSLNYDEMANAGTAPNSNSQSYQTISSAAVSLSRAMKSLYGDAIMQVTNEASRSTDLASAGNLTNPLTLAQVRLGEKMVGHSPAISDSGASSAFYVGSTSAYLGLETIEAIGGHLGPDDAKALLATITQLDNSAMAKACPAPGLHAYSKIETALDELNDQLAKHGKAFKSESAEAFLVVNSLIKKEMQRPEVYVLLDPSGRSSLHASDDIEYFDVVRRCMGDAKAVFRGAATVQAVIERAKHNPLTNK